MVGPTISSTSSHTSMMVPISRLSSVLQKRRYVSTPVCLYHIIAGSATNTDVKLIQMTFTPSAAVVAAYDSYRVRKVVVHSMFIESNGPIDMAAGITTSCYDPTQATTTPADYLAIMRYSNAEEAVVSSFRPTINTYTVSNPNFISGDGVELVGDFVKTEAAWNAGRYYSALIHPSTDANGMAGYQYFWLEWFVDLKDPRVDV